MSHQKHSASGRHSPRRPKKSHRKHSQNYQVNYCERDHGSEKRQKEFTPLSDSSSSYDGGKKELQKGTKTKSRQAINQTEMQLLKEKLDEIEILREQIEVFQLLLSNQDSTKNETDQKNSSCFGFLSALNCKKSKSDLNESPDGLNPKNDAKPRNQRKKCKKKAADRDDSGKQHRITNNNTIVLPESYALSRQQSGDQIMMNSLNKKLEHQVYEIKEIKDTLRECVDLLRESKFSKLKAPHYRLILDDYINMNRMGKLDNIFPNMCADGGFLSVMNHSEKRFNEKKKNADFADEDDIFDDANFNSEHCDNNQFANETRLNQVRNTTTNRNNVVNIETRYNKRSHDRNNYSDISMVNSDKKCTKRKNQRKHVHYRNVEETSIEEYSDQENTFITDTAAVHSLNSAYTSKKNDLSQDSTENKFPETVRDVYCTGMRKKTVLEVSPFTCDAGAVKCAVRCHKPPRSVTKALSSYSVVAQSRKKVKKGEIDTDFKKKKKHKHPVKFNLNASDCTEFSERSEKKESFFTKIVRFLCCKSNK